MCQEKNCKHKQRKEHRERCVRCRHFTCRCTGLDVIFCSPVRPCFQIGCIECRKHGRHREYREEAKGCDRIERDERRCDRCYFSPCFCLPAYAPVLTTNDNPLAPFEPVMSYLPGGFGTRCAIPLGPCGTGSIVVLPERGNRCCNSGLSLAVSLGNTYVPFVVGNVVTVTYHITNNGYANICSPLLLYDSLFKYTALGNQLVIGQSTFSYSKQYTITAQDVGKQSMLNKAAVLFNSDCCTLRSNIANYTMYNGYGYLSAAGHTNLQGGTINIINNPLSGTSVMVSTIFSNVTIAANIPISLTYNGITYAGNSFTIPNVMLPAGITMLTFTAANNIIPVLTVSFSTNNYNGNMTTNFTIA